MTPRPAQASRPKAVLIAGPTASGKSAAALALAERFGGTVINADSMQVYRELPILAAHPAPDERARAPHRLYGTIAAAEAYSVGRWLDDAKQAIGDAAAEGRVPILAGGTGLYFKALQEGLAPVPDVPPEIRNLWRDRAATLGAETLHRELDARDPLMAARIPPTDSQRIVRALEVIDATSISLADWQGAGAAPVLAPDCVVKLVIAPERAPLYAAIDARFDRMLEAGAIEEVGALLALGLDPGLPAMRAHGVRELAGHLSGRTTRAEAVAKAKTETRRYAKRQMTWLKRFMKDWDWAPDGAAATAAVTARIHH
ncbi:MAG TPA: tRNA (adenosine(37)-N6)-dimethylallyltransferase MiaA [Methyloceanibacter sp.]|nr:tRNA (adenosine(37)-N6)-dimethylallyltransferase MiaA [Methyloceanibacter sp.]